MSAILCNIIVCTGVWTAYAMNNIMAKLTTLWFIITVFVLSGTEHIIANMFYMFTSYFLGADLSFAGIGQNLLWVTIGNIIGGSVIVAGLNKLLRMSKTKKA
jgi:formate/nitrite transporter FocA (FNT family)